jgi:hypothetical protein
MWSPMRAVWSYEMNLNYKTRSARPRLRPRINVLESLGKNRGTA